VPLDDEIARTDIDIALVLIDATGLIVDWSDAAAALFGHEAFALLGRPVDVLAPPESADALWRLLEAVFDEARGDLDGWTGYLPVVAKDGAIRTVAARVTLLRDPQGAVCAIAATATGPAADVPAFSPLA
jgi:PAS domain S-box-containing protein